MANILAAVTFNLQFDAVINNVYQLVPMKSYWVVKVMNP
jgi:hypothetical protein